MDIIIHFLQIFNCIGMLAATLIWAWLWFSLFNRYQRLSTKILQLEQDIYVLQINISTIKEFLYTSNERKALNNF